MSGKSYYLNPNLQSQPVRKTLYHLEELELMTGHQLREICQKEKIIRGVLNPLDKEELIHEIMRFHGLREPLLIRKAAELGGDRLEEFFGKANFEFRTDIQMQIASKITIHENRSLGFHDRLTIPWQNDLDGTNALIVSGGSKICGLFYLSAYGNRQDKLYLLRSLEMPCEVSPIKDYELYCFPQTESEIIYHIYYDQDEDVILPGRIHAYKIPLLDLEVRSPIPLRIPLAIDFGSTNTTAGVYLDSRYFEQAGHEAYLTGMEMDTIQYTGFCQRDMSEQKLLPSVAGITAVKEGKAEFVFGHEAVRLAALNYIDEGFCCFYDIKRWIVDYEKEEEVTDRQGQRSLVKRKEILKAFFEYVIKETENRFKCTADKVHISCPVKQKHLFRKLFEEILPGKTLPFDSTIDEGVSVLYNTISGRLTDKNLEENHPYQALIMDCGGGTTDLCICRFQIRNERVAYHIDIETTYENGDTDFGGNNLTFRIMQLLKVASARALGCQKLPGLREIRTDWEEDIYRAVRQQGIGAVYKKLEEAYRDAEDFLPTQYKNYESRSRGDYYKVKNNFYYFYYLAEQVKKRFYEKPGVTKVVISSLNPFIRTANQYPGGLPLAGGDDDSIVMEGTNEWIPADKWKVSVRKGTELQVLKEFPEIVIGSFFMELLLTGDIYGIISKFMQPLYEGGQAEQFSFLRLTGQSCKIPMFRTALKEFIPGGMLQLSQREQELKMSCVAGALKYLRDKYLGYTRVEIHSEKPVLPYRLTAMTHGGQEVELLDGFSRDDTTRTISRNLDQVTLQLFLRDMEGKVRYSFYYDCLPRDCQSVTYEEIEKQHGRHILQKETDSIINQEIKFFVWKRFEEWGYVIVPVFRREDFLHLGREQFYSFENEGWVVNFFDGLK